MFGEIGVFRSFVLILWISMVLYVVVTYSIYRAGRNEFLGWIRGVVFFGVVVGVINGERFVSSLRLPLCRILRPMSLRFVLMGSSF